jgi:hypothetical protein
MKTCTKCRIEKEISFFYKISSSKDGHRSQCIDCVKKYSEENSEKRKEYQSKRYSSLKDTEDFKNKRREQYERNKEHRNNYSKEYSLNNKESIKKSKKDYYEKNKEDILSKRKDYYNKIKEDEDRMERKRIMNRDKQKEWRMRNKELISERIKIRKQTDPIYKSIDSIRTLIWNSINRMGYVKNSETQNILGCSFEDFKSHIESQFLEGMCWENHGEWHLDHKIPISWSDCIEKVYELNHYSNFQPLWAKDNLSKGNKWSD